MKNLSRALFIKGAIFSLAGIAMPKISTSQNQKTMTAKEPLSPELVKDFIYNAHGNLEKVKKMLEAEPGLLNASWDWGAGDFETAMNAAGHTGRVDIAMHLIQAGARMDVFCAAMLGKLDVVKTILTAYPEFKTSKGPHGLMLKHHARQGGENSKLVLSYLDEIGAS